MDILLRANPSYTVAFCELRRGEELRVERSAMIAMSPGVEVTTGVGPGGVGRALLRRTIGGESFFMATYRSHQDGSFVAVAPPYPGDMGVLNLDGSEGWLVQQGSLIAAAGGVDVGVRYGGLRSTLLRAGITMLGISGTGPALVGSYGGLLFFTLGPGEEMTVDSGHLVGFTSTVSVSVRLLGGAVTSVTSGEGLVARLSGPGEVCIQTRSEQSIKSWLFPERWQNTERGRN